MKLKIKERLMILRMMPEESDYILLKAKQDTIKMLSFNEEEIKKVELRIEDKKYKWNQEKDFEKEVKLPGVIELFIKDKLQKLNEEKGLTDDHLNLYEIFLRN